MTNEVRLAEMTKAHGDLISSFNKGSAAEKQFKGWALVINSKSPLGAKVIKANKGKDTISEKGLLECWATLKRLIKQANAAE